MASGGSGQDLAEAVKRAKEVKQRGEILGQVTGVCEFEWRGIHLEKRRVGHVV